MTMIMKKKILTQISEVKLFGLYLTLQLKKEDNFNPNSLPSKAT